MEIKSRKGGSIMAAIILLAIFVVPTSISGTAIALPAIAIDLLTPISALQWVVNGFNLMFACFTLIWGTLADRFGRKLLFLVGVAIYSIASLLSVLATSPIVLDIGRALAGVGAAAIFACGIALLSINFTGSARIRIFAFFGTVAGLGVSLGPTISGVLLDNFGWRSIFLFHLVFLLFVLVFGFNKKIIPWDSTENRASLNFDMLGIALFIMAMFALMVVIVQIPHWGWDSNKTIGLFVISLLLFLVFLWWENKHATPILDLSLLKNSQFVGYSLITVAGSFAFVTLLTYFPTYIIAVLKMTATEAGITMLILTMPMLILPMAAGKLVARGFSSYLVLMMSLLSFLVGLIWLALTSGTEATVLHFAAPLLLIGSGYGTAAGLADGLVLHSIPEAKAGMAAGLFNTFRLGSEAIAVSIYGSAITELLYRYLEPILSTLINSDHEVLKVINDAASGNFKITDSLHGVISHDGFSRILGEAYNHAFINVLWILFSVVLALTIIIGILIRNTHGGFKVQVQKKQLDAA